MSTKITGDACSFRIVDVQETASRNNEEGFAWSFMTQTPSYTDFVGIDELFLGFLYCL